MSKQEREICGFEMDLKPGVENYIFWSEIGSGFEEPGGTPPPRIPRSTPGIQRKIFVDQIGL